MSTENRENVGYTRRNDRESVARIVLLARTRAAARARQIERDIERAIRTCRALSLASTRQAAEMCRRFENSQTEARIAGNI